jgi:hypothetical protein
MDLKNDIILKPSDMKKAGKILGILLLVLIVGAITITVCHNTRHEKRMIRQGHSNYAMNQPERYRQHMPMQNMSRENRQSIRPEMRGKGYGIQPGSGRGMGPGMRRGDGPEMNNGMNYGRGQGQDMMNNNRTGVGNSMDNSSLQMNPPLDNQVGPAGIFIDKIPDVTEKQKQEFADLLQKQKDDMVKMRAEMAAKIKSTLESQRSKMLNIFTSEQKKYIGAK